MGGSVAISHSFAMVSCELQVFVLVQLVLLLCNIHVLCLPQMAFLLFHSIIVQAFDTLLVRRTRIKKTRQSRLCSQ